MLDHTFHFFPGGYKVMHLEILPIEGLPQIKPGDDLIAMLGECDQIQSSDILVVTQKIISKAENQLIDIDPNDPLSHKPLVEKESVRILRRRGDLIISETKHGFVCANAGIDLSNVERGQAALLPEDSDRSALRLKDGLKGRYNLDVAIIISDTFGRPWRRGLTDVAIGSAGISPILDLRGEQDALGREMQVTEVALVDELASAAELVMGKSSGIPVAIIRGGDSEWFGSGNVRESLLRDPKDDLFR
jgi:coenzyme F420-0:L-glutamate ligase/coenzyme F420-1:gamma-L-glutamate ligase